MSGEGSHRFIEGETRSQGDREEEIDGERPNTTDLCEVRAIRSGSWGHQELSDPRQGAKSRESRLAAFDSLGHGTFASKESLKHGRWQQTSENCDHSFFVDEDGSRASGNDDENALVSLIVQFWDSQNHPSRVERRFQS